MQAVPRDAVAETLGVEEFEATQEAVGDVYVRIDPDGMRAELRYVALDPHPPRKFWPEDGSRGRLVSLRARDAARGAAGSACVLPVLVTLDGAVVALPTEGTRASTHLYVPPAHMSAAVVDGKADMATLVDWSRRQVAAFDSWKRGEVFGLVREILLYDDEGHPEPQDVSVQWLRLDRQAAVEALEADVAALQESLPAPRL